MTVMAVDPSQPSLRAADEREYVCLVYQDEEAMRAMDDAAFEIAIRRTLDWLRDLERSGRHVFSTDLQTARAATTLHARNGRVSTTSEPLASTSEPLSLLAVFRARDLNEAIAVGSTLAEATGSNVEVRPVLRPDLPAVDPIDRRRAAALRRALATT